MNDFKTAVNRSKQGSAKWNLMLEEGKDLGADIYPFSVADNDFKHPQKLVDGLKKHLDEMVLGYTVGTEEYYKSVISWLERRHGCKVTKEQLAVSAGVVSALYNLIYSYTKEGDGIVIMPPVYYPFKASIENTKRKVIENPLVIKNGRYEIDFEDLKQKVKNAKMIIFCSPHNPVGRVWEKNELEQLAKIVKDNDVILVSDEIHFDLIMPNHKHTIMCELDTNIDDKLVVCTAPSKSFNLAGLQTSNLIFKCEKLKKRYEEHMSTTGFFTLNALGFKACEIAYNECEDWLNELNALIYHNHLELKKFFNEFMPEVKVFELEGTYLQWLDFRFLGLSNEELEKFMKEKAKLFLDEGYIFGTGGDGYERINIACPTSILMQGLERLLKAYKEIKK